MGLQQKYIYLCIYTWKCYCESLDGKMFSLNTKLKLLENSTESMCSMFGICFAISGSGIKNLGVHCKQDIYV